MTIFLTGLVCALFSLIGAVVGIFFVMKLDERRDEKVAALDVELVCARYDNVMFFPGRNRVMRFYRSEPSISKAQDRPS